MFTLFSKETNEVIAPITGSCIPLEDVPDPVFAKKMMGDGFAIIPTQSIVHAPIDGTIVMIPNTKHAFGIKNKKGTEILVHVGLDTVNLNGRGFEILVNVGDTVKRNTPILKFDKANMMKEQINMITMVIFTSGDKVDKLQCYGNMVQSGDVLIK